MSRYIDKEKLERFFNRYEWGTCDERWRPESEFGKFVDAIPTADVAEVKHGRWKVYSDKYPKYVCTNCNHLWNNKEFRYCPTCGAKMDGGKE